MTLYANRGDLQDDVAEWLDRNDLVTKIPTFIANFEAKANRVLRVQEMLCLTNAQTNQQYTALPADWLEALHIELPDENPKRVLTYKPPIDLLQVRSTEPPGVPSYYTYIGRNLEVAPVPTAIINIAMLYYKKFALANSEATNWLLSSHPDIYLYGALAESAPYLKHDQRIATWKGELEPRMADLIAQSTRAMMSGGPLISTQRTVIG